MVDPTTLGKRFELGEQRTCSGCRAMVWNETAVKNQ